VFIADAQADPGLQHVKGALDRRKVRSISVVPIKYRGAAIGCIFLRTFKEGSSFSDADIKFTKIVAELTAKALRNAHRYESLVRRSRAAAGGGGVGDPHRSDLQRTALIVFLQKLLAAFTTHDRDAIEHLLSQTSAAELDRLTAVAMTVLAEEAKG
jgi:GAF domain-containing protein